jgi:hypothetical protein
MLFFDGAFGLLVCLELDGDNAKCGAIGGVDLRLEGCDGTVGCECAPEGLRRCERGDVGDKDACGWWRAYRVFVVL